MAAKLEGADALRKQLQALSANASGKVIKQAAGFAMTPVVKAARANAPRGDRAHKTYKGRVVAPGFLSRNIVKKSRLSKDKGRALVFVGPKAEAYYGTQFVEVGTKDMPKDPWLDPAYEANKSEVVRRYSGRLKHVIDKVASKQ